jgi:hypothetical protein
MLQEPIFDFVAALWSNFDVDRPGAARRPHRRQQQHYLLAIIIKGLTISICCLSAKVDSSRKDMSLRKNSSHRAKRTVGRVPCNAYIKIARVS